MDTGAGLVKDVFKVTTKGVKGVTKGVTKVTTATVGGISTGAFYSFWFFWYSLLIVF